MIKRILAAIISSLFTLLIVFDVCNAVRLLTKDEAVMHALGKDAQIKIETMELKEPQLSRVLARLGGSLDFSGSEGIEDSRMFTFYYSIKDGEKTKVAIFDTETGRWGPIEFIIAMDLDGKVSRVFVMYYKEQKGYPIARSSWLSQFKGKSGKNVIAINRDITGISGATLSSKSAAFAVRKAVLLYEIMVLNK